MWKINFWMRAVMPAILLLCLALSAPATAQTFQPSPGGTQNSNSTAVSDMERGLIEKCITCNIVYSLDQTMNSYAQAIYVKLGPQVSFFMGSLFSLYFVWRLIVMFWPFSNLAESGSSVLRDLSGRGIMVGILCTFLSTGGYTLFDQWIKTPLTATGFGLAQSFIAVAAQGCQMPATNYQPPTLNATCSFSGSGGGGFSGATGSSSGATDVITSIMAETYSAFMGGAVIGVNMFFFTAPSVINSAGSSSSWNPFIWVGEGLGGIILAIGQSIAGLVIFGLYAALALFTAFVFAEIMIKLFLACAFAPLALGSLAIPATQNFAQKILNLGLSAMGSLMSASLGTGVAISIVQGLPAQISTPSTPINNFHDLYEMMEAGTFKIVVLDYNFCVLFFGGLIAYHLITMAAAIGGGLFDNQIGSQGGLGQKALAAAAVAATGTYKLGRGATDFLEKFRPAKAEDDKDKKK